MARIHALFWALVGAAASPIAATAQPVITSLGTGSPVSVTDSQSGTVFIGANGSRWSLTGGTLTHTSLPGSGSGWGGLGGHLSATGAFQTAEALNGAGPAAAAGKFTAEGAVSPPFGADCSSAFLQTSTTEPTALEFAAHRWNNASSTLDALGGLPCTPSLGVFASGSGGGDGSDFLVPTAISSTGRFIVGSGYISTYTDESGTTIGSNTYQWRPWIWDAAANGGAGAHTVLPTPDRTSWANWRKRTGVAYDVSSDGLVVVGAQEHNVGSLPEADPDGGRLVVWRWNSGTSSYDMTYLPNGTDIDGNHYTYSTTPGTVHMNDAGTIIVGPAVDNDGFGYVAKWTWNSGSSTWNAPINLGSNLTTPASWLPFAVTDCGVPPQLTPFGMSDDGNTVVGVASYSTCGSFMWGGFIWHASDGIIHDWYDWNVAQGTSGISSYGPIGDNGNPALGLPRLGFPISIARGGNIFIGFQGGPQIIPDASPWIIQLSGGAACVPPQVTTHPTNLTYTRCAFDTTFNEVILNAQASGTLPLTYQWHRNGSPITDGPGGASVGGGAVSGATASQLRIANPMPSDAGSYTCTITGCNGAGGAVTTAAASVMPETGGPTPANDICSGAIDIGEGTTNWNPCRAWVNEGSDTPCGAVSPVSSDVFFKYTPTFTGNARFHTCASGFETTIELLDACPGSGGGVLAGGCNDAVGSRGIAGIGSWCWSGHAAISSFPVANGVPIWIRIGGQGFLFGDSASGALTIEPAPAAPVNDLCANPTIVTGNSTTPFDLNNATDDYTVGAAGISNCPDDWQTASNRDVWFRLVSPCGGTYKIHTCGSTIWNPMIHVLDACDGNIIRASDEVGSEVTGCDYSQAGIGVGTCGTNADPLVITGDVFIRVSVSGESSPGADPTSGSGSLIISGIVDGTSGDNPCGVCCRGATCNTTITTAGACTVTPGSNAGAYFAPVSGAAACNASGNASTPCCYPDYDKMGGTQVADIFAYLNDWFAGSTYAQVGGDGTTNVLAVADIFAFLNAWFAGC